MTRYDVVIVGAGHAGAQAAISLRQLDFKGTIAIIGDEPYPPYERPPLSKEYFSGEKSFDRIFIRPPAFWQQRQITMILGKKVDAIDAGAKTITRDGAKIGYGTLVWCAGGAPRRLACHGADSGNVHVVRRRDDVDAMVLKMPLVDHVTIVGGGFVGLEAAAVLTKFGKKILLLETGNRVLGRVAGEELSRFYEAEHRAFGVDVRTGTALDGLSVSDGDVTGVRMSNGEHVATNMVIVGIGIEPAIGPLLEAGANGRNGVEVDAYCRTSLPDIYAVGDCALHSNSFCDGALIRLESVQNANDQAKIAAGHIMGRQEPYCAVPWFWSNQYDLKLQTVGLSTGFDQTVVRGNPALRSFSVVYLKNGRVKALDSVNTMKDFVQGRALVAERAKIEPALLADSTVALKDMPYARDRPMPA